MIDWKKKLTSRKFWMALAGLVSGLVMAFGGTEATATQITALIMSAASVVAFCIGEGLADAAGAAGNLETTTTFQIEQKIEEEAEK